MYDIFMIEKIGNFRFSHFSHSVLTATRRRGFFAEFNVVYRCFVQGLTYLSIAISKPRVASNGNDLPNARLVSSTVHSDMNIPDRLHTMMLMLFGQFLDHDMSRTAISKIAGGADG